MFLVPLRYGVMTFIKREFKHARFETRTATGREYFSCQDRIVLQGPVVRKVDNAILLINHYPADIVVCFVNTYPLDSVIQPLNKRGQIFIPLISNGEKILSNVNVVV